MNTNEHGFVLQEETHAIVGCAMEVINKLGHGLLEKPYENTLVVEFGLREISYKQQMRYNVVYKNVKVGEYVPDLIVFDQIIVDVKVIGDIGNHEKGQILNYLKITGHKVGMILNFKYATLQWKRMVL